MTKIKLFQGDITKVKADVIVNAANSTLLGGGGVDGAIHRAAGPGLLAACAKLGGCRTGEAKITLGYNLPAKFVIHTVGPVWHGGKRGEELLLSSCYRNALLLAVKHKLISIAFPCISTGAYGFPFEIAAPIALRTIRDFLTDSPGALDTVTFVLFSGKDFTLYKKLYGEVFSEY